MKFNTFYEAGLFAGALGPDKDREFLVVDKDVEGLPSDLQGIRREEFAYGGQDLSPNDKASLLDKELTRIADNSHFGNTPTIKFTQFAASSYPYLRRNNC